MMRLVAWLMLAASASCNVICPDGSLCLGLATCCRSIHGYSCCPYPNAVCCADLSHCCPAGFRCNLQAQLCVRTGLPWLSIPMATHMETQNPQSPDLQQDKNSLSEASEASGDEVIRCDAHFYCPAGSSCCMGPTGLWNCCPYRLGQCCRDGEHCCEYGYKCSPNSQSCSKWYSQNSSLEHTD